MDKEKVKITIELDRELLDAMRLESKRQRTTVTGFIKSNVLWCLPENKNIRKAIYQQKN